MNGRVIVQMAPAFDWFAMTAKAAPAMLNLMEECVMKIASIAGNGISVPLAICTGANRSSRSMPGERMTIALLLRCNSAILHRVRDFLVSRQRLYTDS